MTSHAASPSPYCLNCHYTLSTPRPRHCGHCGQETDLHPPSMHEFIHEWVGHYVALEGPLWRTLWALVFLPGRLTVAYFAGQRRRYVLPLRVYLTFSFLFFVGLHYLPMNNVNVGNRTPAQLEQQAEERAEAQADERKAAYKAARKASGPARTSSGAVASIDGTDLGRCRKAENAADCTWFEHQIVHGVDKLKNLQPGEWKARMYAWAPYALLLMQPVYAALLLLMFAGTGRRYAEHFVFSLHLHAFWFLAILLNGWLDWSSLITLAVFAHGVKAMRVVYGRSRWGSVWRGLLLSTVYVVLAALAAGVLSLMAALAG